MDIRDILGKVEAGALSAESALSLLGEGEVADIGYAKVDVDRCRRHGLPEVIYCPGKTAAQVVEIVGVLRGKGQNVLATRAEPELYERVREAHPDAVYHEHARAITLDVRPLPPEEGLVAVVCAGTSDIPVAEEAALAARRMGARVERFYDVGVAGLHRLVRHIERLRAARAIVVAAGMEGALPSVVGGLVDRPIVAVPTSTGYGSGAHGIAALLAMLNSCVPGVCVVNIDNGFGAGVAAAMINRPGAAPAGQGAGA